MKHYLESLPEPQVLLCERNQKYRRLEADSESTLFFANVKPFTFEVRHSRYQTGRTLDGRHRCLHPTKLLKRNTALIGRGSLESWWSSLRSCSPCRAR